MTPAVTQAQEREHATERAWRSWVREHGANARIAGDDFVSVVLRLPRPDFLARVVIVRRDDEL